MVMNLRERGEEYRRSGGRQPPHTMRPADYALVRGGKRPQYIPPIAMRISADLCSEVNGKGNDPKWTGRRGRKREFRRKGTALLLSPRQAMLGEQAGMGVVKQSPCLSGHIASYHYI
ncbi:unnamed protein product [Boreogadus saida]